MIFVMMPDFLAFVIFLLFQRYDLETQTWDINQPAPESQVLFAQCWAVSSCIWSPNIRWYCRVFMFLIWLENLNITHGHHFCDIFQCYFFWKRSYCHGSEEIIYCLLICTRGLWLSVPFCSLIRSPFQCWYGLKFKIRQIDRVLWLEFSKAVS